MTYDNEHWLFQKEFEIDRVNIWKLQQHDEAFFDVSLSCDGNIIRAHKLVVIYGSLLFKNIVQKCNLTKNPFLFLSGVNFEDLQHIINYLYQGQVNIPRKNLKRFLNTAKYLEIIGLCDNDEEYFESTTDLNSSNENKECFYIKDIFDEPLKNEKSEDISIYDVDTSQIKTYNCEICNKKFSSIKSLKRHVNVKHNKVSEELNCCECDFNTSINRDLLSHIKADHKEIFNRDNFKSNWKITVKSHLMKHKGNYKELNCCECDFKTYHKKELYSHIKIAHKEIFNQEKFESDWKKIVRNHLLKHKGIYNLCDQCDYRSLSKHSLQNHLRSKHTGMFFSCSECSYTTKWKKNLNEHIRIKHEGVHYYCDQCSYKTAGTKKVLQNHILTEHEGVRHSCSRCSFTTKQKVSLKIHIKRVHEKIRTHCTKCDYTAYSNEVLKFHMLNKHSNTHLSCSQCDFKTKLIPSLRRHVRTIHEGIYYDCDQCDYKAKQSYHLKRHKESMHENIRYNCDQCEYKATQKSYISRHKSSVHNLT